MKNRAITLGDRLEAVAPCPQVGQQLVSQVFTLFLVAGVVTSDVPGHNAHGS
jgi:hypothetical protein